MRCGRGAMEKGWWRSGPSTSQLPARSSAGDGDGARSSTTSQEARVRTWISRPSVELPAMRLARLRAGCDAGGETRVDGWPVSVWCGSARAQAASEDGRGAGRADGQSRRQRGAGTTAASRTTQTRASGHSNACTAACLAQEGQVEGGGRADGSRRRSSPPSRLTASPARGRLARARPSLSQTPRQHAGRGRGPRTDLSCCCLTSRPREGWEGGGDQVEADRSLAAREIAAGRQAGPSSTLSIAPPDSRPPADAHQPQPSSRRPDLSTACCSPRRPQQLSEGPMRPTLIRATWRTVIGLELHVQFAASSKLFSRPSKLELCAVPPPSDDPRADPSRSPCPRWPTAGSRSSWDDEPNTNVSLFDLGYPGTLPVSARRSLRALRTASSLTRQPATPPPLDDADHLAAGRQAGPEHGPRAQLRHRTLSRRLYLPSHRPALALTLRRPVSGTPSNSPPRPTLTGSTTSTTTSRSATRSPSTTVRPASPLPGRFSVPPSRALTTWSARFRQTRSRAAVTSRSRRRRPSASGSSRSSSSRCASPPPSSLLHISTVRRCARDVADALGRGDGRQDTAKTTTSGGNVLIDYNRAGTGLMEIVTEADLSCVLRWPLYLTCCNRALTSAPHRSIAQLGRRGGAVPQDDAGHAPADWCERRRHGEGASLRPLFHCSTPSVLTSARPLRCAAVAQGELRVDCNISIHKEGEPRGDRVELKNLVVMNQLQKAVCAFRRFSRPLSPPR